ncbi:hypothetical protein [Streptomyces roseus]|uniref:hypothetical protein n=1 Tax=Streptomyces roseus TaxID=66430 RepID=UPI000A71B5E6|nr:hypothetical protein [Streptomyces roseus]
MTGLKRLAAAAALGAAVVGALNWRWQRKHPRVPSRRQLVLPMVLEHASTRMAALAARHTRGQDR